MPQPIVRPIDEKYKQKEVEKHILITYSDSSDLLKGDCECYGYKMSYKLKMFLDDMIIFKWSY